MRQKQNRDIGQKLLAEIGKERSLKGLARCSVMLSNLKSQEAPPDSP
jgi:hypothetical protein